MKQHHSKDFKESIVQKVSTLGGPSIHRMSVKLGVHSNSIRNCIKTYANASSMKKSKEWTPEEKLEVIMKTFSMSEN